MVSARMRAHLLVRLPVYHVRRTQTRFLQYRRQKHRPEAMTHHNHHCQPQTENIHLRARMLSIPFCEWLLKEICCGCSHLEPWFAPLRELKSRTSPNQTASVAALCKEAELWNNMHGYPRVGHLHTYWSLCWLSSSRASKQTRESRTLWRNCVETHIGSPTMRPIETKAEAYSLRRVATTLAICFLLKQDAAFLKTSQLSDQDKQAAARRCQRLLQRRLRPSAVRLRQGKRMPHALGSCTCIPLQGTCAPERCEGYFEGRPAVPPPPRVQRLEGDFALRTTPRLGPAPSCPAAAVRL